MVGYTFLVWLWYYKINACYYFYYFLIFLLLLCLCHDPHHDVDHDGVYVKTQYTQETCLTAYTLVVLYFGKHKKQDLINEIS